jgi:hypothetical protein
MARRAAPDRADAAPSLAHRQRARPLFAPASAGTFGGGSGGGMPTMVSRIHLPAATGEVRVAYEVSVRMLPWPRRPPRGSPAGSATRRKLSPATFGESRSAARAAR